MTHLLYFDFRSAHAQLFTQFSKWSSNYASSPASLGNTLVRSGLLLAEFKILNFGDFVFDQEYPIVSKPRE